MEHPDILEVDVATFDTVAAMKEYEYTFDGSVEGPKRRALLVSLDNTILFFEAQTSI